jgi:hypothetical protein
MLLGSCHLHEDVISTHDQKMDAHELDLDVEPPDSACSYMKQFHQSRSAFFLVQLTIPKFDFEMTMNYFRYGVCENPAFVLFVHTQNLGRHDLIKKY